MARKASGYDRFIPETATQTFRRWATGYVTERERRYVAEIRQRQANGVSVTPAQIDHVVGI